MYSFTTLMYATCSDCESLRLWDNIDQLVNTMSLPWLVGGDFNEILNEEEKIGGLPVVPQEYEDFALLKQLLQLQPLPYNINCIFNS